MRKFAFVRPFCKTTPGVLRTFFWRNSIIYTIRANILVVKLKGVEFSRLVSLPISDRPSCIELRVENLSWPKKVLEIARDKVYLIYHKEM